MARLCEILEDRERLHKVIDVKGGKGMPWSTSVGRRLFGSAFTMVILPRFLRDVPWAVRVYQETGEAPFFDNGFDYQFEKDGRTVKKHYGKLKTVSMDPGTIEGELALRERGESYKPVQPDDPRITRTGRMMRPKAHDESVQLFNMLTWQLGVVGLRTGKVEFQLDILPNSTKEPYRTYLQQLQCGVLPGFIPVHVVCPDSRDVLLERRVWLETYYAEFMASFKNDCRIVLHFIRHRDEVLK